MIDIIYYNAHSIQLSNMQIALCNTIYNILKRLFIVNIPNIDKLTLKKLNDILRIRTPILL